MTITVVLVDDHQMMRDGLRALLTERADIQVVGEADDGRSGVEMACELRPSVVVMDVGMPGMNGIEATRRIREAEPGVHVIALSTHCDRRYVLNMIQAGATGYVLKEAASDELIRAVETVARGGSFLSPEITGVVIEHCRSDAEPSPPSAYETLGSREREVLQLLAEGLTSKEMAARLHVSTKTVETHRRNISRKVGLHTIAELTKYAVREGLTSLEP